jgi:UDP-N-acetylmuramoyl-tripeptide--D-alanyl-D-alanine ligase
VICEMRLSDAAIRFGGILLNPDCMFSTVAIDSRKTEYGDLFVALIGERLDAHDFLYQVADKACGLVVSTADKSLPLPQWVVPDTTVALGQLALLQREQYSGVVVAITGSTGKTSVKEMVASIFASCGSVHATKGNFNNHVGVPLTFLAMEGNTDFAVIEMGASGPGEIEYLCSIAKPHIALINNVQQAHLEGFGSVEGIAAAKGEIYAGLSDEGIAVLNIDQLWLEQWRALIGDKPCVTFSAETADADVSASEVHVLANGCCHFVLHTPVGQGSVSLTIPGRHAVSNALAASACAIAAGATLQQIIAGLEAVRAPARRLEVKTLPSGAHIIDDTYNASPASVRAAIDVLAASPGRRVMVFGDMAELGADADALHEQIGAYALAAGIDALYTVGRLSAAASAVFNGQHFADAELLKRPLVEEAKCRELTLLVKGSRSAKMDLVVDMLMAEKN